MLQNSKSVLIGFISVLLPVISPASLAVNNPDATIVQLRKDCGILDDCFPTTSEVVSWLDNTRNPNAGPLRIEIGPGRFGAFNCNTHNDVSLVGSGPGITILQGGSAAGIHGFGCFNFNVQDLTAESIFISVRWEGDGSSTWSNVHVLPNSLIIPGLPNFKKENTYGWSEGSCDGISKENRPVHRWVSSRIVATGKTAYLAACSENWFFGTQLVAAGSGFENGLRGITVAAFPSNNTSFPEVHVYGGNIQVVANDTVEFDTLTATVDGQGIIAAVVGKRGELHVHGTGIDVIGNNNGNNIAALGVADGGFIHASESAYVMKTGAGGKKYRILNEGGIVKAPYTWEEEILTPGTPALVSDNGKDMVIENVCSNAPTCTETRPHMMVYTAECTDTGGPWFDTTANACRQ